MRGIQPVGIRMIGVFVTALFLSVSALAQGVVTDLSDRRIEIRYSFDGADLILFGAVDTSVLLSDNRDFDVVVAVRGPEKPTVVRKKGQFGAIWVNREAMIFPAAPGYYAVASSRPMEEIADSAAFVSGGIGFTNLRLAVDGGPAAEDRRPEFMAALKRVHGASGLVREGEDIVEIIDGTLFKTNIRLPAAAPVGEYYVDAYIYQGGAVVGRNRIALSVVKEGFERAVYTFAHSFPFLYGLTAVLIALGAGWVAGVLGKK